MGHLRTNVNRPNPRMSRGYRVRPFHIPHGKILQSTMRWAWILSNVDGIVCAFDSDPTKEEILDTINHYHGEYGKIIANSSDVYTWQGEDQIVEYTMFKADLL